MHGPAQPELRKLPLLRAMEERARERRCVCSRPLSLTLSPFVPHGERGLARRDVSGRLEIFAPKHQ